MDHHSSNRTTNSSATSGWNTGTSHHTPAPLQPRPACIEPPLRNYTQNHYGNSKLHNNHHRYHSASSSASSNSNSAVSFASGASSGVLTAASGEASSFIAAPPPPPASSAGIEDKIRNMLYEPIRRLVNREVEGLIITPSAVSLIERKLACLLYVLLRNAPTKIADVRERIRKLMPQLADLVIKDANEKRKKQLILPYDRLHELICDELRFLPNKIDPGVSLYIVAVMEYMARDLLVFVGRFVRDKHIRRCEITENDILIIIQSDPSFHKLFEPDAAGGDNDASETSALQWIAGGDDVINYYSTPSPATNPSTPLDAASATHSNMGHNNNFNMMIRNYYASLPQQELNFAQIANELWAKQKEHCELLNMIRLVFRNALRIEVVRASRAAGAELDETAVTDADLCEPDRLEFETVFGNIDDVFKVAEQFLNQVEDAKDMSPDPAQLAEEMRSVAGLNYGMSSQALLSASSGSDSIGTGSHPASANNQPESNNIFFPDTLPNHTQYGGGSAARHSHRRYQQQQSSSQQRCAVHQPHAQHQYHRHSTSTSATPFSTSSSSHAARHHHLSASSHSLVAAGSAPSTSTTTTPLIEFGGGGGGDGIISDTNSLLSSSSNSTPLHHRRASISTTSTSTTVESSSNNNTVAVVNNKLSPLYGNSGTSQRYAGNNASNTLLVDPPANTIHSSKQQAESPRRALNLTNTNFNFVDYADDDYTARLGGGGDVNATNSATLVVDAGGSLLLSASDKIQFGFCFEDAIEGAEFEEYYTYAEYVTKPEHREALRRLLRRPEIVRWLHASTPWMRDCFLHVLPKLLLYPCYYMAEYAEYARRLRQASPVREEKELLQEAVNVVGPIALRIDRLLRTGGGSSNNVIGFRFSKVHDEYANVVAARLQHLKKTTENYPDSALHQFTYTFECDAYKIKHNQAPSERRLVLFEDSLLLLRPVAKPTNPFGVVASMLKGTNPSSTPLFEYTMKYDSGSGSSSTRGGATKDRLLTANMKIDDCSGGGQLHRLSGGAISSDSGYANALIGATSGLSLIGISDGLEACSSVIPSLNSNAITATTTNATMIIFDEHSRNPTYRFQFKDPEDKPKFFAAFHWNQCRSLLVRTLDAAVREEELNSPKLMPGASYRFTQQSDDETIVFEDDGQRVRAATLEKLIERATSAYNMDMSFITVFLAVYRTFCTAQELMDLLIERFAVPSPLEDNLHGDQQESASVLLQQTSHDPVFERAEQDFQRKIARPIRMRVLNFLRHWIELYPVDFEGNDREKLISKLNTIIDAENKIRGGQMQRCVEAIRGRLSTAGSDGGGAFGGGDADGAPPLLMLADPPVKTSPGVNSSSSAVSSPSTPSGLSLAGSAAASQGDNLSISSRTTTVLCVTDTNGGTTTTTTNHHHHTLHHHQIMPEHGAADFSLFSTPVLWHCTRDPNKYHLLSLHPHEIARQLTLLSHELYCSISLLEFIRYVGSSARAREDKSTGCPNIHRAIQRSNDVSYWVARNIVETPNLNERVAVVSRVIEILRVLVHLHNYTDAFSFIAAFGNASVDRLRITFDKLESTYTKWLEDSRKLSSDHLKLYRAELDKLPSSEPCVPFLGYFLTPLNQLIEGSEDNIPAPSSADGTATVDSSSQRQHSPPLMLINFAKRRRLYEFIEQALRFQQGSYSHSKWKLTVEPTIRSFLENLNPYADLPPWNDSSERDNAINAYLYDKSQEIEPREVVAEFKNTGRIPAPPSFGVGEVKYDKAWLKTPGGNAGMKPRHLSARMNSSSALATAAANSGIVASPSVHSMMSNASDLHSSFPHAGPSSGGRSNATSTAASYVRRPNVGAGGSPTTPTTTTTTTSSTSPRSPASPAGRATAGGGGSLGPSSQRRHLPSYSSSNVNIARERCNSHGSSVVGRNNSSSSPSGGGGVLFGNNNMFDADNNILDDYAAAEEERNSVISSSPTLKNATDDDLDSSGGGSSIRSSGNNNNQPDGSGGSGLYMRAGSGSRHRPPPLPPRNSYLKPALRPPPSLPPKPEEFSAAALLPNKRTKTSKRFVAARNPHIIQQQPPPPPPPPPPSADVL